MSQLLQPRIPEDANKEKEDHFRAFASRMTTGIACASGGAVLGSALGPAGSTVVAGLTGIAGFIFGAPHHSKKHGQ